MSPSPSTSTAPAAIRPGGWTAFSSDSASVDLPEPDSPTRPVIEPAGSVRSTPDTAGSSPVLVLYTTVRPPMRTRGPVVMPVVTSALPQPRVEHLVHGVHDQHDAEREQQHRAERGHQVGQAGAGLRDAVVHGEVDHDPPVLGGERQHAQEEEADLGVDE